MTRTITLLLIIFSKNLFSFSPQISVLPSDTVGIGEEVYLSALSQSDYSSYIDYNFEWNFGDGYFLKRGENSNLNCDGGTSVTHFFMKPGVYTISLKIYSQNGSDSLFSNRKITVKGSEPVTGFECLHSDFHLKIAQPVYVKIPAQYRSSPEYRLNVSITSNGFNEEIFSKSNLSDEEMFILKNSTIPKGDYFFNIRIQNGSNKTFAEIKEPFKKTYNGIPNIGINENNAICINGKPFIPVTPWLLNAGNIKEWKSRNLINCLFGMGNGKEFDQWINYLSESEKQNIPLIGPIFWEGKGPLHYVRNSNINSIQKYIEQAKGSKNLIGWSWQDEPNMGGECQYVPAPVCRSWTYICHNYDPDRLVFINLMGADFFPGNHLDWSWHHSRINKFNYWGDQKKFFGNKDQFGGKPAMIADVIGFDNYPIEYSEAAGFNDPSRGPIDISLESFDNAKEWNKDLLPIMVFIETNDLHGDGNPAPLPSQVYMMAWLNIIHGAKGINWFHYFNPTSLETEKMMALFNKQMDLYQHIILGAKPDVDISDNADVRGRRVDIMVRQKDSLVYIFAGRVTEPSWEYKEVDEPSSIDVTFKTGSLSSRPVKTLFPAESNTLVQNQSGFTDIFSRDQIKIYCISKDKLTESVKPALKGNSSNSLYRILSKKQGNIFENNSDEKLKISIFNTRGQFVKNVTIEPMAGKLLDKELPIGKYIIYSERFKGSFSMVVLKCEH